MPDLSVTYDIPNAFGLRAAEFHYDLDGYRTALGFLSDLAGGTPHDEALELNGGNQASLRAWQGSDKFRRVYQKCRAAGVVEQEATRAREEAAAAADGEEAGIPSGQTFVPLESLPVRPSIFSGAPDVAEWGG